MTGKRLIRFLSTFNICCKHKNRRVWLKVAIYQITAKTATRDKTTGTKSLLHVLSGCWSVNTLKQQNVMKSWLRGESLCELLPAVITSFMSGVSMD